MNIPNKEKNITLAVKGEKRPLINQPFDNFSATVKISRGTLFSLFPRCSSYYCDRKHISAMYTYAAIIICLGYFPGPLPSIFNPHRTLFIRCESFELRVM